MGKFKDKFKQAGKNIYDKANEMAVINEGPIGDKDFDDIVDDIKEDKPGDEFKNNYDADVQPAQKPESFHHFLLANKYKDLELLIRGYKMVFNKDTNKWETKRMKDHCFTDEEAEHILRLAETHLSADIKLSYISLATYPIEMLMIKAQLDEYFYNIADYKYGRYGDSAQQFFKKQDNLNINMALMARIKSNYSMAIQGSTNKQTHNTVKGQESLSNTEKDVSGYGGGNY